MTSPTGRCEICEKPVEESLPGKDVSNGGGWDNGYMRSDGTKIWGHRICVKACQEEVEGTGGTMEEAIARIRRCDWLEWMKKEFWVRGLSIEDAADLLVEAGMTVAEYERRYAQARPSPVYGGAPPSIMVFIPDDTAQCGYRVSWH